MTTMTINLNHYIMNELKKKIVVDKSDKTVKNLICLLFDIFPLSSYFNLVLVMIDPVDEYIVPKINMKHSIMNELKRTVVDKSENTVKNLIGLLFDISLLTSDFNLVLVMTILTMTISTSWCTSAAPSSKMIAMS